MFSMMHRTRVLHVVLRRGDLIVSVVDWMRYGV